MKRLLWLPVVLIAVSCGAADEYGPTNAAFYYWQALAYMPRAGTSAQAAVARYAANDLLRLSPRVLEQRPQVFQWLLAHRPARLSLFYARQCPRSRFRLRDENSPGLRLDHLEPMADLGRRALAVAMLYESRGDYAAAGEWVASALLLAAHLDDDNNLTSGLAGADIIQDAAVMLEGFLARAPPPSALAEPRRVLMTRTGGVFRVASYLRAEAERVGSWVTEEEGEQRLRRILEHPEALEELPPEEEGGRELIAQWSANYMQRMDELAAAVEQPYSRALAEVRRLDRDLRRAVNSARTDPMAAQLTPEMERLLDRFTLAEAQWRAIAVLLETALYRGRNGSWAPDLETASADLPGNWKIDPFSGRELHYRLVDMRPRLVLHVPRWLSAGEEWQYRFDFADRRKREREEAR